MRVKLTTDNWTSLNTIVSVLVGTKLSFTNISNNQLEYILSDSMPTPTDKGEPLGRGYGVYKPTAHITQDSPEIWVKGVNVELSVFVRDFEPSAEFPQGAFSGTRALNVQFYEESNIKLGLQFEGSKDFGTISTGTVLNTIFKTGNLPVSLKKRSVSFTGAGVTAEIFINPVYSGGTLAEYQNANTITPVVGLSEIIVGSTVTSQGDLTFAPVHAFGNASNQGKGGVLTLLELEHILAPNTAFLLRLTSLDAGDQRLASHLAWYEGALDLPL